LKVGATGLSVATDRVYDSVIYDNVAGVSGTFKAMAGFVSRGPASTQVIGLAPASFRNSLNQ
jgi:hypothetical protein